MFYSIGKTMLFLPWVCIAVVVGALIYLEVREYQMTSHRDPGSEERGGLVPPPGKGYEYYIAGGIVCYIHIGGGQNYRIYLIEGSPTGVVLYQDKYGTFFRIRAKTNAIAESMVDQVFI